MSDKGKNNSNQWEGELVPFGNNLLRKMDEFFASEPHRSILDSIDAFFQNHPFAAGFPVDLYETQTEWIVKADLPGVRKEDIHIETLGDRLRIAVINNEQLEENNEGYNYYRRERRLQKSERVIQLPYSIYKQKTKARYQNGILEVRGPKYPKTTNTLNIE
ncbi:MAG: Hsp20/alpha crystallin family protein [Tuberibacillus sp.]